MLMQGACSCSYTVTLVPVLYYSYMLYYLGSAIVLDSALSISIAILFSPIPSLTIKFQAFHCIPGETSTGRHKNLNGAPSKVTVRNVGIAS